MATKEWKSRNKNRIRAYSRKHYKKNRDSIIQHHRQYRNEIRKWFGKLKAERKCLRCPETHPACLDFHHRDSSQKEFGLSKAGYVSKKRILKEIEKCDVLCANCHRKEEYTRRQNVT